MAIEYERVNWDTTKYVNPTNMNQMDAGIKAACDGVDENSSAITAINSTLSDDGWEAIQTSHDSMIVRKFGPIVNLLWWTDDAWAKGEEIVTLPDKYIPKTLGYPDSLYFRDFFNNASIKISNNGVISAAEKDKIAGDWALFFITYMTT